MKLGSLFPLALLSLSGTVLAQPVVVDREKVWFKPTLTVNAAPLCADILRAEQGKFFATSATPAAFDYGLQSIELNAEQSTDPNVEIVKGGYPQVILTRPNGQRVFVKFERFGGCGGGCETQRVLVADKLSDQPSGFRDETSPGTPRALEWTLYKGPDAEFYVLGVVDEDRLHAYRLTGPASVEQVCEVALQPGEFSDHSDPEVRRAWRSLEALRRTYGSMTQRDGNCGTLHAHGLRASRFEQALQAALSRPWLPLAVPASPTQSQPSVEQQLQVWALGGIAEYRAWQGHLAQRERTTDDLARFYREKFAWHEAEAKAQAAHVVLAALEIGFAFSSYYAPAVGERPLRQAILERQPLATIKQIELGDRSNAEQESSQYDSILNVAIEYPEALQYLLSKGIDPNAANPFGKTPLMYAAQYNQLDSTRILLAAGANPNAATFLPQDDCYYTIMTSGMTPLHYAARYSSAPLIRMLVAAGAATSNKTTRDYPASEEYPLDWLKKHTGNAVKNEANPAEPEPEQNPNLAASELPALFDLLRVRP